jgi:hypothetical protein
VLGLASQVLLIPCRGEGGSALVGEGDTDTPMPGCMERLSITWDMAIHTMVEVMYHPTGIHIDTHELHYFQDELE